jgi:dolichol-phosphate mannosyltransferase
MDRPLPNSYWVVPGRLLAGEYPFGADDADARARLARLEQAGVDYFVDLTHDYEQPGYRHLLPARSTHVRSAIADTWVPNDAAQMRQILSDIRAALSAGRCVYVHCRAGIGRTGLVIGCFLAEEELSGKSALERLNRLWRQSARAQSWPKVPQTSAQADYIRRWPKLRSQDVPEKRISETPLGHESSVPAPRGPLIVTPLDPSLGEPLLLSMIVPTFNEALNIERLVTGLAQLLDGPFGERYEIIIVDDDSPDRTWELAQKLAGERPRLRVMRRMGERGLSSAVVRGWQAARGEILCVIDADLQHPPDVALVLYRVIERGAQMAVASRHLEGGGVSDWSMTRRIVSRTAQLIGLLILPSVVGRVSDPLSGYFMIRRNAIEGVLLNPLGYKILIEVLARGRFPWVGEVPYVFSERAHGGSKATAQVYVDYLRHLVRLRFSSLPINRFIRFATVGLSGVIVDMALLYLLSDPTTLAWGLTRSKLIAAEMAILNNFFWNDRWTFRDLSAKQRGFKAVLRRFGKFQLVCLAGVAINATLLNLQFNLLGMNRYVANAVAIAAVTAWNFWLNLKISWRMVEQPP